MDVLQLYVSTPVACFRVAQAREYWETYLCPPPSTVYGMLLSLIGEPNRLVHQGAEIAVALVSDPPRSVVLRTLWRVKNKKAGPGIGNNKTPGCQELLTDVRLSVWVRQGRTENVQTPLVRRLDKAFSAPKGLSRFGGLSLGESTHLVDEVRRWRRDDAASGRLLVRDDKGHLSLPIWPDHVGSKGTLWGQFRLEQTSTINTIPLETAWVAVSPPGSE